MILIAKPGTRAIAILGACVPLLFTTPALAAFVAWTHWNQPTSSTPGSATATARGELTGVDVTYTTSGSFAQLSSGFSVFAPTSTFTSALVDNAPPSNDLVAMSTSIIGINRVTFATPVENPVMAIVSLGLDGVPIDYEFNVPFDILNSGPSPFGNGALTKVGGDVLRGTQGSGLIQFHGSVSALNWVSSRPEGFHGFTLGSGAPLPSPPIPVPEPRVVLLLGAGLLATFGWRACKLNRSTTA